MMKNAVLCIVALIALSCSPYKAVYKSRTDMTVVLVNDTVLYFAQRGGAGDYPYRREGNLLKVPAHGEDQRSRFDMDMYPGEVFAVYKDSIVMLRNNLVFYDKGYYERHEAGATFYFIRQGIKYKVTPDNIRAKPYFDALCEQYICDIMPPGQALKEYGVDPNYDCWVIYDIEQTRHDPHDQD